MPNFSPRIRSALTVLLVIAFQGVFGQVATTSITHAVHSQHIRDWSVPIIWGLVIIVGGAYLLRREGPPVLRAPVPPAVLTAPATASPPAVLLPPVNPIVDWFEGVTGETQISASRSDGRIVSGTGLNIGEFTLGEMALLRRLVLQPTKGASSHECRGILMAAGFAQPDLVLLRLKSRQLLNLAHDTYVLTSTSVALADSFSELLRHDLRTTLAYHKVTQSINKTVRFDGKPLVADWAWAWPGRKP